MKHENANNPSIVNVGNDDPYDVNGRPFYVVELKDGTLLTVGPFDTESERQRSKQMSLSIARRNNPQFRF